MIETRFGESAPWSVGVEEEMMILDGESYALVPRVEELIRDSQELQLPGRLKTELFASIVELNTSPCATALEAYAGLRELRRATAEIAGRHGLLIAAAGTHPFSDPEEQEIASDPRYGEFVGFAGVTARRQGVSGLHVHVGMASAEDCYRALEGVLPWLPLVLALSANSPYLEGRDTGLASNRAEVLAQLPRSGAPPAFGSYAGWESFVERLVGLELADDYTRFWWDARPHPRFGTLEIRMPDQTTAIELSGAFVALLQALCVTVLRESDQRDDAAARGDYAQNRWAALRFGTDAELIHPDGTRLVRVPELAGELLERIAPAANELGSASLLEVLDPRRCEAEQQLTVGRAADPTAVAADLAERTIRSG